MVKDIVMEKFEEREPVVFENEGQKIFGVIHKPITSKPVPGVVICHGFAGNKIGKYRIYVSIAQQLAQAGIATLRLDFRGSGESEGEFSEMTIDGEVSDTLKGLDYLRSLPEIDPNRVGLIGNSFGGAVATLAAQRDQQVRSLALLAPLFNSDQWRQKWESLKGNMAEPSAQREMQRILEGNSPGPAFYHSFFQLNLEVPLTQLKKVPLLLVYSEKDERVGPEQTAHFKACRKDATAETRWVCLDKSDHDFSILEERKLIIHEITQWLSKTL